MRRQAERRIVGNRPPHAIGFKVECPAQIFLGRRERFTIGGAVYARLGVRLASGSAISCAVKEQVFQYMCCSCLAGVLVAGANTRRRFEQICSVTPSTTPAGEQKSCPTPA